MSHSALLLLLASWALSPSIARADDAPRAPLRASGTRTATRTVETRPSTVAASRAVLGAEAEARRSALSPAKERRRDVAVALEADARASLGIHAALLPDANGVGGTPVRSVCVAPCTGRFRPGRWALSLTRPSGAMTDPALVDITPSTGAIELRLVDRTNLRRLGWGLVSVSALAGIGVPVALQVSGDAAAENLLPLAIGGVIGVVAGIWLAERDDGVEASVRARPDRAE